MIQMMIKNNNNKSNKNDNNDYVQWPIHAP